MNLNFELVVNRDRKTWNALVVLGALAVALYNIAKWRQDRALAERLRHELLRPRPRLGTHPGVSILVAAWNEAGFIERHLQSVAALSYPNLEYVVCAGGGDGTLEIVRRLATPGMMVVEQLPGEGKQGALRKAFEYATGEIICLTDADCLLDNESFEQVLAPLINDGEAAASGLAVPLPEQWRTSRFAAYQSAIRYYAEAHAPLYRAGLDGCNAAVRRNALEAAGAFAADVPVGTDYHLAKALLREGYKIRHVVTSSVATRYAVDWRQYSRQQRRWLRNVAMLGAQTGAWDEVGSSLQTSLLGAAMLLGPFVGALLGRWLLALWSLAFAHSVLSKLRYLAFTRIAYGEVQSPRSKVQSRDEERDGAASQLSTVHCALITIAGYTLLDFLAWALPLVDYPLPSRRRSW